MTSVVIRVDQHVKAQLDEHRWKTERNYNAAILRLVAIYEAATSRVLADPPPPPLPERPAHPTYLEGLS